MVGFFTEQQVKTTRRPTGRIHTCATCGRYLRCKTPKFKAFGEGQMGIVNVLPYPSQMQDETADITKNKNVRYLVKMFNDKGIDLARDCITLFAVECYNPKKVKPLPAHIEACRPNLLHKLKKIAPKLIFLYGDASIRSVIGHNWHKDFGQMEKWVGSTIPDQELNAWVCPLELPEIKEEGEEYSKVWHMYWERGFSKLYEVMDYVEPEYTLFTEEKDICRILRRTNNIANRESFQMAFDYETTGLKPHDTSKHKIVCISFSYRIQGQQKTYCIKVPTSEVGLRELKKMLQNPNIDKIAHNMKFEGMWTKNILGYDVDPWLWDSQLASHILDSKDGVKGLKFQTYVNFGVAGYDDEVSPYLQGVDRKDGNSLNRILEFTSNHRNYSTVMKYCAMDSLYTLALAEKQMRIILGGEEL